VVERRLQWAVDVMRVVAMWPDRHHRVYTCVATLSCGARPSGCKMFVSIFLMKHEGLTPTDFFVRKDVQ
jgi:hypothetical protein